jgi:hypothetical protein
MAGPFDNHSKGGNIDRILSFRAQGLRLAPFTNSAGA